MSTINARRPRHERVEAAGVTVHETHHAVCETRLVHPRHGPAHSVHGGRRTRRMQVSRYRAVAVNGAAIPSLSGRQETDTQQNRRAVVKVLIVTSAVGLLYLGFLRLFQPENNDRLLLLGVCLIAVAGAVILNAMTIQAMIPWVRPQRANPAPLPNRPSPLSH